MAKEMVCSQCGAVGTPVTHTPGSILIEIVLWCMFLLPGLLYSAWRMTARAKVCRECGSKQLVPPTSPVGRRLLAEMRSK